MKLLVGIVNTNETELVIQCLDSIINQEVDIEYQVVVVDNNSVDGSCQMMREKFPNIKLIENKKNLGFSKANNKV